MSFNDKFKKKKTSGDFKKTEFMDLPVGIHTIRFLDDSSTTLDVWSHFLKGKGSFLCLEDDCPICQNNRELWAREGKAAKENPNYSTKTQRFYVNVLDKTPVMICPKCEHENKKVGNNWLPTCQSCGELLVGVKPAPLMKVKVLNKGQQFFDLIDNFEQSTLDEEKNPVPITQYDFMIIIGADKKPTPSPMSTARDPLPEGLEKFDLHSAIITMDKDELIDVLKGVSLRDIFAARNANKGADDVLDDMKDLADKEYSDIQDSLDELFPKE